MSSVYTHNKSSNSWSYQVLFAFVITAIVSLYYGYLMPGNPLSLYQFVIIIALEALVFAGWGRAAADSF